MDSTQYRHDLLKKKVISDRRFNVSKFCKRLGITRTHFYDVINGSASVSEKMVARVASELGFEPDAILKKSSVKVVKPVENLAQMS